MENFEQFLKFVKDNKDTKNEDEIIHEVLAKEVENFNLMIFDNTKVMKVLKRNCNLWDFAKEEEENFLDFFDNFSRYCILNTSRIKTISNEMLKTEMVSINGIIGVGKSHFINMIETKANGSVEVIPEPVDLWCNIKINDGEMYYSTKKDDSMNIFEWFYKYKDFHNTFVVVNSIFQYFALVTRYVSIFTRVVCNQYRKKYPVYIVERIPDVDKNIFLKCFTSHLDTIQFTKLRFLSDYSNISNYFEVKCDHVFLGGYTKKTDMASVLNTAQKRLEQRNRDGEIVPLEYNGYLYRCHKNILVRKHEIQDDLLKHYNLEESSVYVTFPLIEDVNNNDYELTGNLEFKTASELITVLRTLKVNGKNVESKIFLY